MTTLIVSGGFQVDVEPAAVEWRDKLLAGAAFVTTVADSNDQEIAVKLLIDIKEHLKAVESARKRVKEPIRAAGSKVDSLAMIHTDPLQAQFDRVSRLVAGFQEKERLRVAQEERKRAEAIAAREAEERRLLEEARTKAGAIQNEADLTVAIAAEQAAAVAVAQTDATIRAPLPAAVREPGMIVRKRLDFDVTDIHLLYKARPEFVRMEANRSAILSLCTINSVVPGLRFTEELTTTVRT